MGTGGVLSAHHIDRFGLFPLPEKLRHKHLRPVSSFVFVFMWLVLFSYLVYVVEQTDVLSSYLIPFCIVPIIIKNFLMPGWL